METLSTVFVIVLCIGLMFGIPFMAISNRADDVTQLTVETATVDFVDDIRTTGKITLDGYSKFEETISSTGNAYDIELEIKSIDENPGKKTSQVESTKIGENVYYSIYTSQILEKLDKNKSITLKEGDIISAKVKNKSPTTSIQFMKILLPGTDNDIYTIAAEHAGMVTTNGNIR